MKKQQLHFNKRLAITLLSVVFASGLAFGQGNNWKLNLNNNVGINDGIGSSNNADLKFFSNNQHRMSVTKEGDLVVGGLITGFSGTLVLDLINDRLRSTIGEIYMGNDNLPNFSSIKIGVGIQTPEDKIHAHDDTPTDVYTRYTNGITGSLFGDGFQVGVFRDGIAHLRQLPNIC